MKVDVLVAEIGSTTTVVNAFKDLDTDNPVFWAQGEAPTSVLDGDVRIGLQAAIKDLCEQKGIEYDDFEYDEMLATSSAAGGLKMTVHGLVYDMTAKAAKEAALGAGGIIHNITVGKLRRTDIAKIKEINPNLILIAGGVDYGERDTAIENAEKIRALGLKTPVIYAGNIENQEEMKLIFDDECGQPLYLVDNVYPKIDTLNVEPCRKVIQSAFEDHITKAPGMEYVRDLVSGPIIPTPGAVMECTKLLYECLGDTLVIDVGGATTDVHAVTEDSDAVARVLTAPEPKAKRTVEGDLGVFVNRYKVIESIGEENLRKECGDKTANESPADFGQNLPQDIHNEVKLSGDMRYEAVGGKFGGELDIDLDKTLENYVAIPKTEDEFKLVERLTQEATLRAVERHAGQIRYVYGPSGRQTVAEGKDLTQIKYIVGTGGALTRLPHNKEIMELIAEDNETGMKLYPGKGVKILADNDYIMASLGVLSKRHKKAAVKLLEKSLGMKFPERKKAENKGTFVEELQRLQANKQAKEDELKQHIAEMEEMGYDMSAYKEPEKIGGATKEEVEVAKRETLKEKNKTSMPHKAVMQQSKNEINDRHIMRSCGTIETVDGKISTNCTHECEICSRRNHCPNSTWKQD